MNYTLDQLRALAASVGFPDPSLAAAVAMAESGGNSCAQGDPNTGVHSCSGPNGTSQSFGLWQVHTPANPQFDPASLLDATYNARAALAISRSGTYWTPWTTYNTGAYRQWYVTPPYSPADVVTPPARSGGTSTALVAAGALALAAAAGFAVYQGRRGRREAEPEPFVYP
jgi:hypothetical protein